MGWVNWNGVGWIWMFGHAHEQALGIPRPWLDPMFGKLINKFAYTRHILMPLAHNCEDMQRQIGFE